MMLYGYKGDLINIYRKRFILDTFIYKYLKFFENRGLRN